MATVILVTCIVWEVGVQAFRVPPYVLPAPTAVLQALFQYRASLSEGLVVTLSEMLLGLAAGIFLAGLTAIPTAFSSRLRSLLYPLLVALDSIPKIALAPLIAFWLGIGLVAKGVLVATLVFFPALVVLVRGLLSVDEESLVFAQSLCAPKWRIIWKIHVPAAIPSLFDCIRLAVPLAMVGAVIGEFISSESGLGNLMLVAIGNLNMPLAFATLAVMSLATMLCYLLLVPFERRLLRWQPSWRR